MNKILIADDERALRLLVAGTLEIGNYSILETDNGIDALKMAVEEKPDLIILDVMMPGIDGYEVCRKIKTDSELKDTKILILTAKGQQTDKIAAKKALADYYLAKPFSPAELLVMVEEILGG
ncbi:MAG TPA: response regulator [Clostridia bacterium]|nr:response regulator [Clostridia bacterium]